MANGALDANAIFRYQNTTGGSSRPSATTPTDLRWHHASNNAVGKIYLDSWKSQNTADAKVVTYIQAGTPLGTVPAVQGPDPETTPSGVHNPNPEGDIWIDTQDNFRIYRYQVIGSDVTTNTAYQTPNTTHSGWADARDARIGDFPFSESRKAYVPMNEWSIETIESVEELVMYDYSGNRNHARINTGTSSDNFSKDSYDFVDTTIKGISTKALNRVNSITIPSAPAGVFNKNISLLHHDDIRNANQQSYSIWFKPSGVEQRHGWNIISRDYSDWWSVQIGGNSTHSYTSTAPSYEEFYPAVGSYVNAIVHGGFDVTSAAASNIHVQDVLKYNVWNFIAFTLDYKGDNEVGNSVWYFANEDDGWENANVFHYGLDPQTSANLSIGGDWTGGGEGRGVGLQAVETAHANGNAKGHAAPGYFSEFRYYDTYLSQSSIKKLYDFPFGVEDTSKNFLQTIRSQAIADGEIISFLSLIHI